MSINFKPHDLGFSLITIVMGTEICELTCLFYIFDREFSVHLHHHVCFVCVPIGFNCILVLIQGITMLS